MRLYRATREEIVRRRVLELCDKVAASYSIIDKQVPLSALGRALLEELRVALHEVVAEARFG
jgi:hypothetical protein